MTIKERVRYEMFIRVVQFIQDNIADFPGGGIVAAQLAVLVAVVDRIQELLGLQIGGYGDSRFEFNSKDTARENLREMLSEINSTARSMIYEFPGIELKFRMIRNRNDAELLGAARAFLIEMTPLISDFERYGQDKNSPAELQTLIDDFEQSLGKPGTAIDSHVEATAEIGAEIRKGMIAVRTMRGVVINKYRPNVGKSAAWFSASRIEKLPQTTTPQP